MKHSFIGTLFQVIGFVVSVAWLLGNLGLWQFQVYVGPNASEWHHQMNHRATLTPEAMCEADQGTWLPATESCSYAPSKDPE